MFDTITGIPLHPLVVHGVVVLGPLTALLVVAYALKPAWRVGLRWPTVGLAVVSAVSAFAATQSGEALEHRVGDPAYDHAEKGDLAAISIYVLLAGVLLIVFVLAKAGQAGTSILATVLAAAVAVFALGAIVNAGHSGASSVWKGSASSSTKSGGGDGD